MQESGNKDLVKDFGVLKREISTLRNELNSINDQKEIWFQKKEDLKKEVLGLINEIKILRDKKNNFNKSVKNLKGERDKYNKEVKEKIEKIKELNFKKKDVSKDKKAITSPGALKETIKKLELYNSSWKWCEGKA